MAESYVGKPCPKCRHVRTAADSGPDWQCPKCGIAYAKFGQPAPAAAPAPSQAGRSVTQQVSAGRTLAGAGGGGSTGLAMFVHLSLIIGIIIPFFGLIVPIVVWITKKDSDQLATANAKEAINFQITMILWVLVLIGLTIFAPIFGLALAVVLGLVALIMPIVAAVKANGGDEYRYPITLHIFS
jgi:uncharacterized Tic20 family protein/ribosomal protein L37AE/L43A